MTYTKSLVSKGLLRDSTLSRISSIAGELSVSQDDVLSAWLEEMANLHCID